MNFVRSMWLVLCVGVCSVASASGVGSPAQQMGPTARTSAHSASYTPVNAIARSLPQTSPSATTFYSAPYGCDDYWFGTCGKSPTIGAAVVAWWDAYQHYWGVNSSNCSYSYTLGGATPSSPSVVALIPVSGSACGGTGSVMGTAYSYDPAKNSGKGCLDNGGEGAPCDGDPNVGDPINASTGNKYLQEDDYLDNPSLTFRRFYNSTAAIASTAMGTQWRHSFDRTIEILGSPATEIVMFRPDGSQETFTKANGVWTTTLANVDTLTETDNAQGVATSYTVFLGATRHSETYGVGGHVLSITDETGQTTTLTYNTSTGQLVTVTDPNNRQLGFTYDTTTGHLDSVEYPDSSTRTYVYNEPAFTSGANLPNALTGIIDENGVRYANTGYNTSGLATSSSFMSTPSTSVLTTQLTYNSNGTTTMLYPLGHSATMGFTQVNGLNRVGTIDQPCGPDCGQPWQTLTYDTNGYPASYTDFKGNLTTT